MNAGENVVWKDIIGYEGLYEVSDTGRVRNKITQRVFRCSLGTTGYHQVHLRKNSKPRTYLVHRLVAQAFLINENKLPQVNHVDEDKSNNDVSNLEWCTPKQNANHGTRIERITNSINYSVVGKKNSKPIKQINKDSAVVRIWNSIKECQRETGFDASNIIKCCKGKAKTSYGFLWEYL